MRLGPQRRAYLRTTPRSLGTQLLKLSLRLGEDRPLRALLLGAQLLELFFHSLCDGLRGLVPRLLGVLAVVRA